MEKRTKREKNKIENENRFTDQFNEKSRDSNDRFTENVFRILIKVPKGKVISYKRLAELAGNPKAARAVGNIMKHNKKPEEIPCYKVVKSNGEIGGYSGIGGLKRKIELLKKDGIEIKNGKIDKRFFY